MMEVSKEVRTNTSAVAAVEFSVAAKEKLTKLLAKYEIPQSALLPALYIAQEEFGFLSPAVLIAVAKILNVPPALAFESASFYTMFKKQDMGKWCLQVCNNVTCTMMGSEELLQVVKEEIGLVPGQVGEDKVFSLLCVQCLGSCDTAPVVQVNDDYIEKLNPEKFRQFLRALKQLPENASPQEALKV